MPKNIVICCDGTGNEYGNRNSNVVSLYRTLVQDTRQVCYYHPGVGTEGSPTSRNRMESFFSIVAGMGWGAGLLDYVGDAYRFLMDNYEPGDEIYLFGFSRGAYTVRALSGMIAMYGLLHRGNIGLIPYILKMYAKHTRDAEGMTQVFAVADGFKAAYSLEVTLQLVGVWDTVSSVGVIWDPLKLPYTARNPIMKHGRHAVSIDEKRCFFRNNLWGLPFKNQSIRQVWFAGVHSDVGGSYPADESGLSQVALKWMLCEAVNIGLLVNDYNARVVLAQAPSPRPPNPVPPSVKQQIHKSLRSWWWLLELIPQRVYDPTTEKKHWSIPLGSSRTIPPGSIMHPSVLEKLNTDPTYRPKNLPEGWQGCLELVDDCRFDTPPVATSVQPAAIA
jgi:uncharacterized protein (DUF2235 family)